MRNDDVEELVIRVLPFLFTKTPLDDVPAVLSQSHRQFFLTLLSLISYRFQVGHVRNIGFHQHGNRRANGFW